MGWVGSMILGGTITTPNGDWQVMGCDHHQQVILAARLPLTPGEEVVHLGGRSLRDGSWVWSVAADTPWRTSLQQATLEAIGITEACLVEAYSA